MDRESINFDELNNIVSDQSTEIDKTHRRIQGLHALVNKSTKIKSIIENIDTHKPVITIVTDSTSVQLDSDILELGSIVALSSEIVDTKIEKIYDKIKDKLNIEDDKTVSD